MWVHYLELKSSRVQFKKRMVKHIAVNFEYGLR